MKSEQLLTHKIDWVRDLAKELCEGKYKYNSVNDFGICLQIRNEEISILDLEYVEYGEIPELPHLRYELCIAPLFSLENEKYLYFPNLKIITNFLKEYETKSL